MAVIFRRIDIFRHFPFLIKIYPLGPFDTSVCFFSYF